MRWHMLALAIALTHLWTPVARAEPEVSVTLEASPTRAQVGDVIRLEVQVRVRGGRIDELDFEDLNKYPELEVISHQTVRPVQFTFGFGSGVQVESSLGHVYTLRATAPGEYVFRPAVARVQGKVHRSAPLTLSVRPGSLTAGSPGGNAAGDPALGSELSGARFDERAFLRTVVEPQKAVVGQQVNVTVYLYTRLRLAPQSVTPSKPAMEGFWVHDDPITNLQAQTVTVAGMRFRAYVLQRSAAFPQRAGELTIGAPKVTFDVGSMSLFDAPERIQLEGVPVTVEVEPLPTPAPANAAVGRYTARAALDRTEIATGDAVTLRVDVSGLGNVQDLRIDLPPMVGVRALQPAIRDSQQTQGTKLAGTRSWEWILIPERPGKHRVPSIAIPFFDPEIGEYASTRTPELTFTATGEAKPSGPTIEPKEVDRKPTSVTFGPLRLYSALERRDDPVRSRSWFAWLLAIPPMSFLLVVVSVTAARRRERLSGTTRAVQRRLLQSAEDALRQGDPRSFYDHIVAAITHALDARLGEPVGGLTHSALRDRLAAAGFDDELVQRVVNELEGADFARFAASGVDRKEMDRCLQRTRTIIERTERATGAA